MNVPVYFYYLRAERSVIKPDGSIFKISDFISFFSDAIADLIAKKELDRKIDYKNEQKIVWLDFVDDIGDGNMDLVFKSAKYNHRRKVRDTVTMSEKGLLKKPNDGDEEKNHICIRYKKGNECLICIRESNYYGVGLERILNYLNTQFRDYQKAFGSNYIYQLRSEIMPCDSFLEELRKMKTINLLKLVINTQDLKGDEFSRISNRDDLSDYVDLIVKKKERKKYIPKELVREYYADTTKENKKIQRVIAEGKNDSGFIRLDTELIKMKQSVDVSQLPDTNEVDSDSFFEKTQDLISLLRKQSC